MTATTAVLSMPLETTRPSRTLRRFTRAVAAGTGSLVASLIIGLFLAPCTAAAGVRLERLGRLDLALAQDRVDPRHLAPHLAEAGGVVQPPGHDLEAQVEQLDLVLLEAGLELVHVHLAELLGLGGHQTCTSSERTTKRALIGSFWMARS